MSTWLALHFLLPTSTASLSVRTATVTLKLSAQQKTKLKELPAATEQKWKALNGAPFKGEIQRVAPDAGRQRPERDR